MKGNGKEGLSRNFAWMKCEGETEERNSVTVWTYSMPIIDVGQEVAGKTSTRQRSTSPMVDWPAVVRFLWRVHGSMPLLAAALSVRVGRQVSRHRLQRMVGKYWKAEWQPAWDVGNELLAMEREAREHDTERAA